MKIYTFWSGDTTYITKSKSLKKAQEIGRGNMKQYVQNCEYLEEAPESGKDYFIPESVEIETNIAFLKQMIKQNSDCFILETETEMFLMQ